MTSVMDVVGVYTSWAQTKKISDAALWKGSGNCVSLKEKQNKFAAGLAHVRVAEWVVTGQEVALIQAQDHATTHFKVVEGPRCYAYLDAIAPASNAPKIVWQVPVCAAATGVTVEKATVGTRCSTNAPKFVWQVPICAAATGITVEKATVGTRGQCRNISAHSQFCGFLCASSWRIFDCLAGTALRCFTRAMMTNRVRACTVLNHTVSLVPESRSENHDDSGMEAERDESIAEHSRQKSEADWVCVC